MIRLKFAALLLTLSCTIANAQWSQVGPPININAKARHDLTFNPQDQKAYMAFIDKSKGDKVSVAYLENNIWKYLTSGISSGQADDPHIEITASGTIYIAFIDFNTTSGGVTVMYKTPTSSSWLTYGSPGFTPQASHIDFHAEDLSDNNTTGLANLFVAYRDFDFKITVEANDVNCSCWNQIGSTVYSQQSPYSLNNGVSMEVHNDKVSIAYGISKYNSTTSSTDYISHIRQIDLNNIGTIWPWAGNFAENGYTPDLAVDPFSQELTVAWVRYNGSTSPRDLVVKQFDGSNWNYMGSSSGIGTSPTKLDLEFNDLTGRAHILFNDGATSPRQSSVKQFNGSSWQYLGQAQFATSVSIVHRLAFSPQSSLPHVTIGEGSISNLQLYSFYDGCSRTLNAYSDRIYTLTSGFSFYEFEIIDPIAQMAYLITVTNGDDFITASQIPNHVNGRTYQIRSRGFNTVNNVNYYQPWTDYCYITMPASSGGDDDDNDDGPVIFNPGGGNKISIYPNPSLGEVTLTLGREVKSAEDIKLNIFSTTGQLVKTIDPTFARSGRSTKLDLNDLSSGVYLISGFIRNEAVNETFIIE